MKENYYASLISLDDALRLEEYLKGLCNREIDSVKALEEWLMEDTQLSEAVEEILTEDYINFQCHNDDEEIKRRFIRDQEVITPLLKRYQALIDKKFYESKLRDGLDPEKYREFIKSKVNSIEIFREENIPLEVEEEKLAAEYMSITGKMTVMWEGKEITLSRMEVYLRDPDRSVREKAWKAVRNRRLEDKDKLDEIMDKLIHIRHNIALNAGFTNYRDYMFRKYERFSYTPEDCYKFHDSVKKCVVPLKDEIEKKLQSDLHTDNFMPWDAAAVPEGVKPLHPFDGADELVEGVIRIFDRTDIELGNLLRAMRDNETLDLESRKAKSPGGFCASLPLKRLSFIFMNASGIHKNMVTLVHEGGHSFHNMLKEDFSLARYKSTPMEVGEFASMGMELLSMDKWDEFYKNEDDLRNARKEKLEEIIKFLPWAMAVDKFQHWIYLNTDCTMDERNRKFKEIALSLSHHYEDWSEFEEELENRWKDQLHIFEVPFYYIEYAIAQLGAVQLWKQYRTNLDGALQNYKKALSLGSSKPIPEVYETAGISFDFSEETVKSLMDFVKAEISKLE